MKKLNSMGQPLTGGSKPYGNPNAKTSGVPKFDLNPAVPPSSMMTNPLASNPMGDTVAPQIKKIKTPKITSIQDLKDAYKRIQGDK